VEDGCKNLTITILKGENLVLNGQLANPYLKLTFKTKQGKIKERMTEAKRQTNPVWDSSKFVGKDVVFPVHVICLSRPDSKARKQPGKEKESPAESEIAFLGHFSIEKDHVTKRDEPISIWYQLSSKEEEFYHPSKSSDNTKPRILVEIVASAD